MGKSNGAVLAKTGKVEPAVSRKEKRKATHLGIDALRVHRAQFIEHTPGTAVSISVAPSDTLPLIAVGRTNGTIEIWEHGKRVVQHMVCICVVVHVQVQHFYA